MHQEASEFTPGLKLSKLYFEKEVKTILGKYFPKLEYSAGVLGWGSEVLGYDTALSRDHHWGPRVLLFVKEEDFGKKDEIQQVLSENLPYEFMGYSTSFGNPEPNGVRIPEKITSGPVKHMIDVFTIRSFFEIRLKFDPSKEITVSDWLRFPQQRLLEMQKGEIYHDGLNELETVRQKFSYYPQDIWLYLLACQWTKIMLEEAFVGRCGDVGDELGSRLAAARIIRELMELCFLMEKKYTPYSKWFGTAFAELEASSELVPIFNGVLSAETWKEREKWLSQAYEKIAMLHNALAITDPLPAKVSNYHERPYMVMHADLFAEAIKSKIQDKNIRDLNVNVGSIDQFTDGTYSLSFPPLSYVSKNFTS